MGSEKSSDMILQQPNDDIHQRSVPTFRFQAVAVTVGLALLITVPLSACAETGLGGTSRSSSIHDVSVTTGTSASAPTTRQTRLGSITDSSVALSQLEAGTTATNEATATPSPRPGGTLASTSTASITPTSLPAPSLGVIPIAGIPAATATALAPETREVIGVFERFLQVYSQALRTLDTSHLSEVLSGQALQVISDEVNGLKTQGRPVELVEKNHHVGFDLMTNSSAVLVDEYDSASVYINPKTGEPLLRTGPEQNIRMVYEFSKVGNDWKIVQSARKVLGVATP